MKWNNDGVLPLLVIVVILGIILLFGGLILVALTAKTLLTLILAGAGLYIIIRPVPGLDGKWKPVIGMVLIILGIAFYGGWLSL